MIYPLSTLYAGSVEQIPFFHYYPGHKALIIGTYGCNLDCKYCMNQHLLNEPSNFFDLAPEQVAAKAKTSGCDLISFSANEPAVSFDYFIDIAEAAKEYGIITGCSTNGLFNDSQLDKLKNSIAFANVSLKGPSEQFYHEMCSAGSPQRVLTTVNELHANSVHVEVTTPYVPWITPDEMFSMAEMIGNVSPHIPWHIFRLLPEYKLTDIAQPGIDDLLEMKNRVLKYLSYIYLENFASSHWVDTCCPQCDSLLLQRISTRGCGAHLMKIQITDGACPVCSRPVDIIGQAAIVDLLSLDEVDPRTGLIDVGGWQSYVDMGSGVPKTEGQQSPARHIISKHPYPGDMNFEADQWVVDVALDIIPEIKPDLMVLTFSQPSLVGRHMPDIETYRSFVNNTISEVERFISQAAMEYLIVGLGDLNDTKGVINLEQHIRGAASADEGIACLYDCTPVDAERVKQLEGVRSVITRQEMQTRLGHALDPDIFGTFFVLAHSGYQFLALSSSSRYAYRQPAQDTRIPVMTSLDRSPGSIRDIREIAGEIVIRQKRRLALILIEGIGLKTFPLDSQPADNSINGIVYSSTLLQYMVISTGQAVFPTFFGYPLWKTSPLVNPFSRHTPFLQSCLTRDIIAAGMKSVSIGNRSIMTHTAFPASLSVECHCASLHNYGSLEVTL